jgi:hypothetical protein
MAHRHPATTQTLPELAGRTSILARQRADHARLDRLIARARETAEAGGIAHQVALRALARLVFTHAFAGCIALSSISRLGSTAISFPDRPMWS